MYESRWALDQQENAPPPTLTHTGPCSPGLPGANTWASVNYCSCLQGCFLSWPYPFSPPHRTLIQLPFLLWERRCRAWAAIMRGPHEPGEQIRVGVPGEQLRRCGIFDSSQASCVLANGLERICGTAIGTVSSWMAVLLPASPPSLLAPFLFYKWAIGHTKGHAILSLASCVSLFHLGILPRDLGSILLSITQTLVWWESYLLMTLSSALYFSFLCQFLSCSPCFFSSPSLFLSFLVHFFPLSMLFFPARFFFQLYSILRTLIGNPFSFPLFTHSISPNGTGIREFREMEGHSGGAGGGGCWEPIWYKSGLASVHFTLYP